MRAASFAYRQGFGKVPLMLRCGGTMPILDGFRRTLGIPTVPMGFALPDDRMHAPNERFHLPNFHNGIETSIWFLRALVSAPSLTDARNLPSLRVAYDHRLPLSRGKGRPDDGSVEYGRAHRTLLAARQSSRYRQDHHLCAISQRLLMFGE
jgi:hypothetical protein